MSVTNARLCLPHISRPGRAGLGGRQAGRPPSHERGLSRVSHLAGTESGLAGNAEGGGEGPDMERRQQQQQQQQHPGRDGEGAAEASSAAAAAGRALDRQLRVVLRRQELLDASASSPAPKTTTKPDRDEHREKDAAAAAAASGSSSCGEAAEGSGPGRGPRGCSAEAEAALSAYERKRLRNVTENAKFFASLQLFESASKLREVTTKDHSHGIKRVKHIKVEAETTPRRSMRLQRVPPLAVPLLEKQNLAEASVEEHPHLPPGPIQMITASRDERTTVTEEFLSEWAKISQVKHNQTETSLCNLESYKAGLHGMVLGEDAAAKVVPSRIYSMDVHPSESRTLVAAGDKWGHIGLWNLDCPLEDETHTFLVHSQPVCCLHFSPVNSAHLLSLSFDGTLRCGDVTQAVFDEVYRNEENALSSFDFLASDASTLVVGMWNGGVAVVDRRSPGMSSELSADLNSVTRTVHVHPVSRQYFIAAGATNVGIYDVRQLKKTRSQPAVTLMGHSKSVASAYFSPITGNRVVTTCADDRLRIFGTNCLSSMAPILTTIRHDNNTGRWLTRFRAVWDPKREDCFVVGSMSRPRRIEVFRVTGELVHSFSSEDYLRSVCSINAWHPTRYILAGGNSSGRIHVFKE